MFSTKMFDKNIKKLYYFHRNVEFQLLTRYKVIKTHEKLDRGNKCCTFKELLYLLNNNKFKMYIKEQEITKRKDLVYIFIFLIVSKCQISKIYVFSVLIFFNKC